MRIGKLLAGILTSALLVTGPVASRAGPVGGFGILGDSASDEFRADDNRGGAYAATTLNWAELLIQRRGFDGGPWGSRAEPRRTGYAYNWARSGAVAAELNSGGQASGLASQVASGNVSTVVIMVGANDFALWNGTYAAIYDGTVSGTAIASKVEGILSSLGSSVTTLQAAGPARIFIATLGDRGTTPAFLDAFPDASKRQRVTDAILLVNDGIRRLASDRGLFVVDLYAYGTTLLPRIESTGNLNVGGEFISYTTPGDEPHHLILGDNEHAGTVASGLIANYFIAAFAAAGLDVTGFTDDEILENAGIVKEPPDTAPPSVSITAPSLDSLVSGNVTISASATDNKAVTGVQFVVDGRLLGAEDTTSPYSTAWNTTSATNGGHQLEARARDDAGNVGTALRNVTVRNNSTVSPRAFSVTQGSLQSGSLDSVTSNDNRLLVVRSGTSGFTGVASASFDFGNIARNAVRLSFDVIAKSSTSNTTLRIVAWNQANGTWVQLSSGTIGTGASTRTSTLTSGVANYIDASGTVRIRLEFSKLLSSFSASTELVSLTWR